MTKKLRVYAVTAGSYSDYHVEFLTTDNTLAKQAVDLGAGDHVEEFPLLDRLPEKVVIHRASAWVDPDGQPCRHHHRGGAEIQASTFTEWDYEEHGRKVGPRPTVRTWTCGCGMRCTGIEAISTSTNASVKACADRVAQLRAERLGVA